MNDMGRDEVLTLKLLQAVSRDERVTQRHLSGELNVALGLANAYLKRCARKGLIKVQQAPANRYLYYLTPRGFSEKSRLTARYLRASFDFYRVAGESLADVYDQCEAQGWRRLLLCGVGEFGEIALVRSLDREVEVCGFLDPERAPGAFLGRPVWADASDATASVDAAVLTGLDATKAVGEAVARALGPGRVLVPKLLADVLDSGAEEGGNARQYGTGSTG